jgi:DNA-binding transcriptional regulator YiaG
MVMQTLREEKKQPRNRSPFSQSSNMQLEALRQAIIGMWETGVDVDFIQESTGLTQEQIAHVIKVNDSHTY